MIISLHIETYLYNLAILDITMKPLILILPLICGALPLYAQTDKAYEKIKAETDTAALNTLKARQKKNGMTAAQLKAEAKKRNIPYRKTVAGKIYELQGFDLKGMPLYYQTNAVIRKKCNRKK